MKVIVYTLPDGRCAVCRPVYRARLVKKVGDKKISPPVPGDTFWHRDSDIPDGVVWEAERTFLNRIKKRDIPKGAKDIRVIDDSKLPTRENRDAWVNKAGKVSVVK